jgi:hypothetical protein
VCRLCTFFGELFLNPSRSSPRSPYSLSISFLLSKKNLHNLHRATNLLITRRERRVTTYTFTYTARTHLHSSAATRAALHWPRHPSQCERPQSGAAGSARGTQAAVRTHPVGFPARVGMRQTPALCRSPGRAGAGSVAPRAAHLLVAPAIQGSPSCAHARRVVLGADAARFPRSCWHSASVR